MKKTLWSFLMLFLSFCSAVVVVSTTGCDTILPDEFKSKTYSTPDNDERACTLLSKEVRTTASPRRVFDSSVVLLTGKSIGSFSFIPRAEIDTLTENQIVNKYYSSIIDSLPALVKDSLIFFEYATLPSRAPSKTYAKLNVPAGNHHYTIYISLQYYLSPDRANIGEYVMPEIINQDTVSFQLNTAMKNESISACTQLVSGAGTVAKVLTIRGRFEVSLSQGVYIVRFTLSNPQLMTNPETSGLLYFKIVIL